MKKLIAKAKLLIEEFGEPSIPFLRRKLQISLEQAIQLKSLLKEYLGTLFPVDK